MQITVWLASYPRSGNTFLRTVLHQCFGLHTGSLYPNDLGDSQGAERLTGHIDARDGKFDFGRQPYALIKTHDPPQNDAPAIYVVRDGREAVTSLYHFWHEDVPLLDIAEGRARFGSWAGHLQAWAPRSRRNTLLLRYEHLVEDLPGTVDRISAFLRCRPQRHSLPPRDELAQADGRWIRPASQQKVSLQGETLDRFMAVNGAMMAEFGYR